ncbi:hypothetical protein [Streptomyces sp. NPDC052701]|uniref:hypothetical protein n=1 Tax=Streptomyces sp. NPDC052701 TaxID=3155533 RepID=UPI0034324490
MNSDADSIGQAVSGRTAHRESPEKVSGVRLNEIRERLLLEPKALNEATISWAVEIHSFLSGTRGIARWTDMHKETVQKIAGPTGGTSVFKFLYTATRGRSSVIEEEREDMQLRFNSLVGRSWSPLGPSGYRSFAAQYLSDYFIPSGSWTLELLEDGAPQRGNGRKATGIGESHLKNSERLEIQLVLAQEKISSLTEWGRIRGESWTLLTILDPANDSWTDEQYGKHAWRLAVLFAGQNVVLTQKDVMALTGLAESPVRRLLKKWKDALLVTEEKVGRAKHFHFGFYSVLHPDGQMYDGGLGDKTKLYAAMSRDAKERATAARRGIPEGTIAWKAANPRTRQAFLDGLPEDADPVWRALVERGDEVEMYEHLVAQAKEAGSAPSNPAVLVAGVVEPGNLKRPAQAPPGLMSTETQRFLEQSAEVQQETLAAMRRRMAGVSST